MKNIIISIILFSLTTIGCRPTTPEQLIMKFDRCFLKYSEHLPRMHKSIPGIGPSMNAYWSVQKEYYIIYVFPEKKMNMRITVFSPDKGTRKDFMDNLGQLYLKKISGGPQFKDIYVDSYGPMRKTDMVMSYYGEIIYSIDFMGGYPENEEKEVLNLAFECMNDITHEKLKLFPVTTGSAK